MSRHIAITLTATAVLATACAGAGDGECADCLSDHTDAPDGGPGDAGDGSGDPAAPTIEIVPTRVIDELADRITFAADGAPRTFEHAGASVELGGDGCPVVHKHALLLRRDHGASESPENPVELQFRVRADASSGVDPDGGAYRVRVRGEVDYSTGWLSAAGADGLFTAVLDRAAVPDLLSAGGPVEIEMRGRDLDGREVTSTSCVDLRPIAGPVEIEAPAALPRFSLMNRDPVSPLLDGTGRWPMIQIRLTNGTPDPVFAQLRHSAVTGTCSKRWQKWNVLASISTGTQSCDSNATVCARPDLEPVVDYDDYVDCSPTIDSAASRFDLRVAVDGTAVEECAGCAAGEYRLPPHSEAVATLIAVDVPGLQPRRSSEPEETYADQEVTYRTGGSTAGGCPGSSDCATMYVVGNVQSRSGCTRNAEIGGVLYCTERRTYKMVRALTSVSAAFDQLSIDVSAVSLRANGETTAPTGYDAPRTFDGYIWATNTGSNVPDA